MQVIIAGGRTYTMTDEDRAALDWLHKEVQITAVLVGDNTDVDRASVQWAASRDIACRTFFVRRKHGKNAVLIRNTVMVEYVRPHGALVVFPGKEMTDIIKKAQKAGLRVYDWRGHKYGVPQ